MKKIVLIISILSLTSSISAVSMELFIIGNQHHVIIDEGAELNQLPTSYQPMVLGKFGSELKYDKAYLYCDLPLFFQKFEKPVYADITHLKDAIETAYQNSGWLLLSKISTVNDVEYYINAAIGDYDYQGKTEVYCLIAMAYVDGQAFRMFTECLKENYASTMKTFISFLSNIQIK